MQLAYVVDVDEKQVAHWKAQLGNSVKFVANLDEVLQDASVDAVIVCTPTAAHRDIIVKSVRAKKAVMCEKPISLNIDEIDECYKEAKENGVPLLCGTCICL